MKYVLGFHFAVFYYFVPGGGGEKDLENHRTMTIEKKDTTIFGSF